MKSKLAVSLLGLLGLSVLTGCGPDAEVAPPPDDAVQYFGTVDPALEKGLKSNLNRLMRANAELAGIQTVTWGGSTSISFLGKSADQIKFHVTIDATRYKADATFSHGANGPEFEEMNIDGPQGLKYVERE